MSCVILAFVSEKKASKASIVARDNSDGHPVAVTVEVRVGRCVRVESEASRALYESYLITVDEVAL